MTTFLLYVLQFAVGLVFLYSSTQKIRGMGAFVRGIRLYQVIPPSWAPSAAVAIVVLELAASIGLILNQLTLVATAITTTLCICFLAASIITLRRGVAVPCHCFGGSRDGVAEVVSMRTILRLVLILVAALALLAANIATLTASVTYIAAICAAGVVTLTRWALAAPDVLKLHLSLRADARERRIA